MSLAPLLDAPAATQLHAFAAMAAFALGLCAAGGAHWSVKPNEWLIRQLG